MIGSIIGGAIKLGSSIFGGISASKAMKKVKSNLEDRQASNEAWFNRRYNEDATQRADAQRLIAAMDERMQRGAQQAAATQAVAGGTEEGVAATKAANTQAAADVISQISAAADRRKDAIEHQYMNRDDALSNQLNNLEMEKAGQIAKAVQGVGDTASSIAGSF